MRRALIPQLRGIAWGLMAATLAVGGLILALLLDVGIAMMTMSDTLNDPKVTNWFTVLGFFLVIMGMVAAIVTGWHVFLALETWRGKNWARWLMTVSFTGLLTAVLVNTVAILTRLQSMNRSWLWLVALLTALVAGTALAVSLFLPRWQAHFKAAPDA